MSTWSKASSWGACLTRGQPDQSINTLGHKMSLPGGTSDQRSAWPTHLTKMSTWPKASSMRGYIWLKVSLTQRPDKHVNLTWSLTYRGIHLTKYRKVIWKFEHILHFRSCLTDVFSMKDQKEMGTRNVRRSYNLLLCKSLNVSWNAPCLKISIYRAIVIWNSLFH